MKILNQGKKSIKWASAVLVLALAFLVLQQEGPHPGRAGEPLVLEPVTPTPLDAPKVLYGIVIDGLQVIEAQVKRNQRFIDLLDNHHVDDKILRQLSLVKKSVFDFRKVEARKKYTLLVKDDSTGRARALIYEPNPIDYYIFHLEDTLLVEACHRPLTVVEKSISGVVESTLSETIEALGISHELTNRFVDIFAWQVDFQKLQRGDRFKLIYQENQVEGDVIGIRRIEAVHFEHEDRNYFAFPFDQGTGTDYFDDQGESLRKELLKYPIEFTRISSRYNPHRFHPVVKVVRAHRGTDFAAPRGTPIRSVGDGMVVEARYKGGNGNYVKIRHNDSYSTGYLHMSRIADGIRAGTTVRQGQTIGFVGSTGLANGPHLCYRFWRNGVQVDALNVKLPPAQPILEQCVPSFEEVKEELIMKLEAISFPIPVPEMAASLN